MESVISKKDLQTQVHFGKQLIFLTQHIFFILESYKRNYHIKCVNKIQEFWIRHSKHILYIYIYILYYNLIIFSYKFFFLQNIK